MLERPFELGDLEQPVVELTPEQAENLRGGLTSLSSDGLAIATNSNLPAVQDTNTSGKVPTHDLQFTKLQDKTTP